MRPIVPLGTLLLLTLACQVPVAKPQPSPSEAWAAQVKEASAKPAKALTTVERPEYAQGFENGAAMVRRALDTGRKPYVLLPEAHGPAPAPKLLGPTPEDIVLAADPPEIEMDAATGLRIWAWGAAEGSTYSRGQRDGFAWALAHHGTPLIQPHPRPALPEQWLCWPSSATSVKLETATREAEVFWRDEALLWRAAGQGFPAQRRWRAVDETWKPRFVALQEDVLWLDTLGQGAVALDLETGLIRELKPSPHPRGLEASVEAAESARAAAEKAELEAFEKEYSPEASRQRFQARGQSPEALARRKELRAQAEAGDLEAMFILALDLAGLGESENRESAVWLQTAAEKGHAQAMGVLGAWHYEGRGVPRSEPLARAWLEKAARSGDGDARQMLASLFGK